MKYQNIKKILSTLLIFTILLPTIVFADGNYNQKLKHAISKSKTLFNITEEYDKFTHDINTIDDRTYFYLNWFDSKEELGAISVNIDEEGNIIGYTKTKKEDEEKKPVLPKYSKKEGFKIAEEFLKEIDSSIYNNVKYIESNEPLNFNIPEYRYEFVRVENGIVYSGNTVSVCVHKDTGEVTNYYTNWNRELVFPEAKDLINENDAKKAFIEKIGLKLIYRPKLGEGQSDYYLVYGFNDNLKGIDARTGQVLEYYEDNSDNKILNVEDEVIDGELIPDEEKAIKSISNLINIDEAEKKARIYLDIDEDFKLESRNLYSYWKNKGEYTWILEFTKKIEDDEIITHKISVDGKTGELISFYSYNSKEDEREQNYTKEQSFEIAKKFVNQINSNIYNKLEFIKEPLFTDEKEVFYYFYFPRIYNEAYVEGDGISIVVDNRSGNVISYNCNWYKGKLETFKELISLEEAYNTLFDDIGIELCYVTIYDHERLKKESSKINLGYCIKENKPLNISAKTGQVLGFDGNPYKKKIIYSYNDIDNSYAKEKIDILMKHGVGFPSQEFKPKKKITQTEFLYLLFRANSPYYELDEKDLDNSMYNYLNSLGILNEGEKAPDSIVTKEEGIKYIIRALKHEKVAQINGIYKDLFKDTEDIDEELKGYVAIAYGLNIVQGSNGYLRPKAELKREDAANMIYNYLFSEN